jgi:hypothetical protein
MYDQLHCNVCDYGYYMLTLDDSLEGRFEDPSKRDKWHSPENRMRNVCVKRCEDYAHNYVSNPNTMKCECKETFLNYDQFL